METKHFEVVNPVHTLGNAIAEYYRLHFAVVKDASGRPREPDGKE